MKNSGAGTHRRRTGIAIIFLASLMVASTGWAAADNALTQPKARAMCTIIKASHRLHEPDVDRPALICCRDDRAARRCRRMSSQWDKAVTEANNWRRPDQG